MLTPLVETIPYVAPELLFSVLPQQGALFLDSALKDKQRGQYSFIAFSPFKMIQCKQDANPFPLLKQALEQYQLAPLPSLPPFQGGMAGVFGYELNHYIEIMPPQKQDDLLFPELILGFYDLVFAWDHSKQQAFIFSSGFPEFNTQTRTQRAIERLNWALSFLKHIPNEVEESELVLDEMRSTFTQPAYEKAVERVIEYIRNGDIFEVNISQRFAVRALAPFKPFELYCKLRRVNPAPFAAYFAHDQHAIASASPERFLRLSQKQVETRPIKGTRPRGKDQQQDLHYANELLASEKDKAENVMIVDLMRNDLSRVCLPSTIHVPQLCELESFANVHHLVSVVTGELAGHCNAIDLIQATFPGGSITGAPKIRAMEIIAEMEPTVRGPYCGSIGYIGFNGEMDLSITIRTFSIYKDLITYQVGGAVTIDSSPEEEYFETLAKAKGLRLALGENLCQKV